ncbi:hypothetical protein CJ203_08820 [Corynebacterium tuscaniense]|uniref:Uncharacterized protein n=1 Tax=Corynebacterium tuscaniense TaxID=302449 RepID=A0A2N6T3J0_9CORY|nr:hypothetical protein [Corynebacterium tuscaniense]PMC63886.1 hypothetical protein CJ203_08820 [Corynebacterium tuscaniense]
MNLDKLLGGVPDGVVDILKDLIALIVAAVKLSGLTKPEEEKRDMAREVFGEYSSDSIVSDLFGVVSQFF